MKKQTGSDKIKALLTAHPLGGGLGKDWTRLSKKRGDKGSLIREFSNAKLGRRLTVVEHKEGRFEVLAPVAAAQSVPKDFMAPDLSPVIETDPAANAAADRIIELYMKRAWDELPEEEQEALLKTAGRAINNRCYFALSCGEEGDRSWFVTPRAHWEKEKCCEDGTPRFMSIPRGMCERMEANYEWRIIEVPIEEQARVWLGQGYVWNKGFQAFILKSDYDAPSDEAKKFLRDIEAAQGKKAAAKPRGPKP